MSENGILEAEQRVREMNRMTRQYSEQGNRYLQSMRNAQNIRQTRFEPAEPYLQEKNGQDNSSGNRMVNPQQQFQQRQNMRQNPQQNQQNQQNQQLNRQQQSRQRQPQPQNQRQNWQQNWQQNGQQNGHQFQPRHDQPVQGEYSHSGNSLHIPVHSGEGPSRNEIHDMGNSNPFPGFPDLIADNEKLMILLLMYLLMKEKADIKLILALGYLLL